MRRFRSGMRNEKVTWKRKKCHGEYKLPRRENASEALVKRDWNGMSADEESKGEGPDSGCV